MRRANLLALLLALLLAFPAFAAGEAGQIALDEASGTARQTVTVLSFIDGDTVHFSVPESVAEDGVLRARFLGLNTPESTGRVDPYGKKAAAFTKERLSGASSILIESDTADWNTDTTGSRYLVWVWYRTDENEPYRCLNLELLRSGLARANNSGNRYGAACAEAVKQAQQEKLNLWSGEPDPDYSYGSAAEVTVKELRLHPAEYEGKKVAFEATVIGAGSNSVYVEDYDAETDRWYGMYVYYGRTLNGAGLDILRTGNRARVVGTMQFYENGGVWEITGLTYWATDPAHPDNLQKLGEGFLPAYQPITAADFASGQVTVEGEDGPLAFGCAELSLHASVSLAGLTVKEAAMNTKSGSSYGALTLLCEAEGAEVTVYTPALYDENRALLTGEYFLGKTLEVRGIVDLYQGAYQIKVANPEGFTFRP